MKYRKKVEGITCPKCGSDKYIYSMEGISKIFQYECTNCKKLISDLDLCEKKEQKDMNFWKIEILRYPTDEDWKRCLLLARTTQGKFDAPKEPSEDWKRKILRSGHSPIRTLMFTIAMYDIPYCNSVHFVRHKFGVEHYVQSQRKNPERGAERQDAPVTHIMDINAQELIFMANKRLCYKADRETHRIMNEICWTIRGIDPVWDSVLKPACDCDERNCREFKPCGMYRKMTEDAISNEQTELDNRYFHNAINQHRKNNPGCPLTALLGENDNNAANLMMHGKKNE